jgi:hypothetical protein
VIEGVVFLGSVAALSGLAAWVAQQPRRLCCLGVTVNGKKQHTASCSRARTYNVESRRQRGGVTAGVVRSPALGLHELAVGEVVVPRLPRICCIDAAPADGPYPDVCEKCWVYNPDGSMKGAPQRPATCTCDPYTARTFGGDVVSLIHEPDCAIEQEKPKPRPTAKEKPLVERARRDLGDEAAEQVAAKLAQKRRPPWPDRHRLLYRAVTAMMPPALHRRFAAWLVGRYYDQED